MGTQGQKPKPRLAHIDGRSTSASPPPFELNDVTCAVFCPFSLHHVFFRRLLGSTSPPSEAQACVRFVCLRACGRTLFIPPTLMFWVLSV